MKSFPTGIERKELIRKAAEKAQEIIDQGKTGKEGVSKYGFKDSALDSGNGRFLDSFKNVLPEGEKELRAYIEKTLKAKKGKAVGIEFGGMGYNLFSSFQEGFFKKSMGVTLVNDKSDDDIRTLSKILPHHKVFEGNILAPSIAMSLEKELDGEKFDFITERLVGGFETMPPDPYLLSKIFQDWYRLLNEGGLMLIQTPVAFDGLMEKWVSVIKEKYPDVLDVQQFSSPYRDDNLPGSTFRLIKLPGSPETLPFLDPRTVRDIGMAVDG